MATANVRPIQESAPLQHMIQLDGLRALAVIAVFYAHFKNQETGAEYFQWGWAGVHLFFVLSGFLITRILLECREKVAQSQTSLWFTFKNFYIRRFLRIFPIYYLFLLVIFIGMPKIREDIWWYLTYLQNIKFAMDNQFVVGHIWTLAVEEQFYLVWPFLILWLPKRALLPAMILAVAIGPLSRIYFTATGWSTFSTMVLTPCNLDTLAMGSILAWLTTYKTPDQVASICRKILFAGIPLGIYYLYAQNTGETRISRDAQPLSELTYFVLADLAAALIFTWVIYRTSIGFRGPLGMLLSCKPMTYLGKISYGLYVYHYHVHAALERKLFPRLGIELPESEIIKLLVYGGAATIVASLSWHFFEKPLNNMKRHFPYVPRREE
ncbi:O-acetyltransferase OatA [Polystyrenella longa]|uniref:O-acetyltransferase OatA n=1 Tax=Polystyrenella longa TaxID=2528007 RepID=A0A518CJU1_9PLAN|nr:acyltransferase [Polystyrenella longa]QDU79492.1 O-acetyltransferase OatA [Polystyrenella longa]